jgi:hypothetical protein
MIRAFDDMELFLGTGGALVQIVAHPFGSRPLLVTSGEVWYLPYFYTKETRTARP